MPRRSQQAVAAEPYPMDFPLEVIPSLDPAAVVPLHPRTRQRPATGAELRRDEAAAKPERFLYYGDNLD